MRIRFPSVILRRMATLTIDPGLKLKCPRISLGFLTGRVVPRETPTALLEEMKVRETEILHLPEPRTLLESSKILATRAGYKALGKDPARYRGSAEALLRRLLSGKGFPQINSVVDIINLISVKPFADRPIRPRACNRRYRFSTGPQRRNLQGHRQI